jgi:hypothetical protein
MVFLKVSAEKVSVDVEPVSPFDRSKEPPNNIQPISALSQPQKSSKRRSCL